MPTVPGREIKGASALGYETIHTPAVKLADKITTADLFETFITLPAHTID